MLSLRVLTALLLCFAGVQSGISQTVPPLQSTNLFEVTFNPKSSTPTNNVFFISESTNALEVKIANTNIFTNIVVTAQYGTNVATNAVKFLDTGKAPDKAADDGIFTGNIITPFFRFQALNLPVLITVIGEDLTFAPADGSTADPVKVTNIFDLTYLVLPRPANDKFTNSIKIQATGGIDSETNNLASIELSEPVHAKVAGVASSIWWTWSPSANGPTLIDTAGSTFPAVLAVYAGQSLTSLVAVASSTKDVPNNLPANVAFDAIRGTTYQIAVSGLDGSTNNAGTVRLRVAPNATPDTRPPTVSISSPVNGSLVATESLSISGIAREAAINDSGVSNVVLQVNNGPLTNAVGAESWAGRVTLTPGTNVIRAFAIDYAGNIGPADSITIRFFNPTNDLFLNAQQLQGTSGQVTSDNRQASKELGEPLHADNEGGHSIWYKWRAPAAGDLQVTTQGSVVDTLLGVYVGNSLSTLSPVASNDDEFQGSGYSTVNLTVSSNQLYYIAIDGYGGKTGPTSMRYFFDPVVPGQFFTVAINSSVGGVVSPPAGVFPANARVTLTAVPDTNFVFVGWDGSVSSTENPLVLTITDNLSLTPHFQVQFFTDDFETGNLTKIPWTSGNGPVWSVQTNTVIAGKYSARSAVIGDGGVSSLVLATNTGPGTASFDLRVSSEGGWDFLQFYLNGSLLQRWSGETNLTYSFPVPAGANRFEWRYTKDGNFSLGMDAAFIDNLFLPPDIQKSSNVGITILLFPEGAQISVQGQPSQMYSLEASSDMRNWTQVGSKSSASGVVHFLDTRAPSYSSRFYRTVVGQ